MKSLHRPGLYSWSRFDAPRNVDFHGLLIVREGGNVVVDPMPLSEHDAAHLDALGGAAWVVVTNSDHVREAEAVAARTGARIAGPAAEQGSMALACARWLADGDTLVPGIEVLALEGSKTPGELALLIDGHTLVTGDLVRAHVAGSLMMLPDPKLTDREAAVASVRRLAALPGVEAVLVGDGWPVFRDGKARLEELAASL
ncbi:MAG: MBL fold metallo-hydrolase [Alphaproteobacteria bacterium]|nr:MBL fold metallo-hydrolase [Alphaproteobacteria bacterium]